MKKFCLFFLCLWLVGSSKLYGEEKVMTLKDAIDEALKNNSLIKEAIEKEKAALSESKSAQADLFPKVHLNYNYSRLKETPYAIFGINRVDIGPKNNFYWDVTVSQPLFTGFALETKKKIAELGFFAKSTEKERVTIDVVKQVKVAYFRVLLAKRFVEVAKEQEAQLKAHMEDAQKFYDQGLIPQNDLLKSQVAYARAIQERVSAESNLEVAISAFNTLLRRPIEDKPNFEDISTFKPTSYELSSLMKEAIQNRPEMKELSIALEQARLGERLAKSGYYPKVYLVGQYKQQGENIRATENDFQNSHNASVSIQITWPIFESGKTTHELAKATHERLALSEKIKAIEDSIMLEVKDAYEKLKVSEKNIKTAEIALEQAKENYRITNLQYQQQMTTSTEVLDARTYLTQAQVNYYNALYGYYIAKAELERAIGKKQVEE